MELLLALLITAAMGIGAALITIEAFHVKAERRKQRRIERMVWDRCRNNWIHY